MDVIVIFNGLGNQMSQYSFYQQKKSLSNRTYLINFCNDHNGFELNKVFNINFKESIIQKGLYFLFRILLTDKVTIITKPLKQLLGVLSIKIIKENFNYNFNNDYLSSSKGITFYFGGWHTEKYFSSVKDRIFTELNFNLPKDIENTKHISNIALTNSVSIHVRRGDFLNSENIILFGDVCNKAYFEKAIELIKTKVNHPHFFIFSNDMEWVKIHLPKENVTYITNNTGQDSWKDMYLMSLCKHNIISNSTFSWWGAWLNKNKDKIVISPSRFLKNEKSSDVYPDSWIKLHEY